MNLPGKSLIGRKSGVILTTIAAAFYRSVVTPIREEFLFRSVSIWPAVLRRASAHEAWAVSRRRIALAWCCSLGVAGAAMVQGAQAQVVADATTPEITTERHPEDWSHLADPAERTGRWTERFKYIELGTESSDYLTTGVEGRLRYEAFSNPFWGEQPDDDYVWHRLMPYADLHAGQVRLFAQPVLSAISGTDRPLSPVDSTGIDILQTFAEVELAVADGATLNLSAGRKVLTLGAGRFIDSRYGPNILQPFDGVDATLATEGRQVRMLYVRPVDTSAGHLNDRASRRQAVWGLYGTQWLDGDRTTGIDLFYLGFLDRAAVVDQGAARQVLHTFGGRIFGQRGNWFWNLEGAVQRGSFGDGRVEAFGFGTESSHRFASVPLQPVLALTLDYASGDRDPNDDKLGTMNALFPKGQYFVTQSPIGPRNLVHVRSSLTLHLRNDVAVSFTGGGYWRASVRDGVYNMPGFLERSGRGSNARFISRQYEFAANWQATPELALRTSVSIFNSGRFIRETGPSRTISALVTTATFRF